MANALPVRIAYACAARLLQVGFVVADLPLESHFICNLTSYYLSANRVIAVWVRHLGRQSVNLSENMFCTRVVSSLGPALVTA